MFWKSRIVVGRGNNLIREPIFTHKNIISDNYDTIISTIEQSKFKGLAEIRRNGHSGRILGSAWVKLGETETSLKVVRFVKTKKKEFQHFFWGGCMLGRIQFSTHLSSWANLSRPSLKRMSNLPLASQETLLHNSVLVQYVNTCHDKMTATGSFYKGKSLRSAYREKQNQKQ